MRCVYLHSLVESRTLEEGEPIFDARHPGSLICFGIKNYSHKPTVDELSKYCDCKGNETAYEGCSVYVERHKLDVKKSNLGF